MRYTATEWNTNIVLVMSKIHKFGAWVIIGVGNIVCYIGIFNYIGNDTESAVAWGLVCGAIAIFLLPVLYFELDLLLNDKKIDPVIFAINNVKMTMAEFDQRVCDGAQLVLYQDMVLDVKSFLEYHPGGQFVIKKRIGYDITNLFNGSSYYGKTKEFFNEMGHIHSNQARLIVS